MTWRFRKSFSPLPGVRLTLSPSGISTSVGFGPLRLTAGQRGPAFTANIPGTGISFRQPIGTSNGQKAFAPEVTETLPTQPALTPSSELTDIESMGSGALTTAGLAEFKQMLERTRIEHDEISKDLESWRLKEAAAVKDFKAWEAGWLFRRILVEKFQSLRAAADEATAHRAELEEQERLSRLQTQLELPKGITQAFHRLCDEFSAMAKSQRIWDTVGQRNTNRIAERTTASRIVDRKLVSFRLGKCELIESEWNVPHLENANGGDIYFYPAFVLYFVSSDSFALLEYKEARLDFSPTRFIEEEAIPSDSTVVGNTWAKANKDGSPDKRFSDNYQIPIAQYGKLSIGSTTGMNEEYMISNVVYAEAFAKAWQCLATAINAGV